MKSRTAFSLLELILALGLTVVIMSAITVAVRTYLFQLQKQTEAISRRQVAHGALRMVSDDIRSAIQFKPEDYAGLEDLIESQNLAGLGGATAGEEDGGDVDADALEDQILNAVANGGDAQQAGAGATDGGGDEAEGDGEGESEEEEVEQGRPTLIGTQNFIRIDISRLPRLDQYNPLIIRSQSDIRLPADVKTVTYFFSATQPVNEEELDPDFGNRGGLYRREIDRAVEAFQSGDNDIEIVVQPDEYCELISPEISAIEFRYWDGEDWLVEWDSSEMMGFPSAIEVAIIVDPERFSENVSFEDLKNLDVEIRRTVISIPVAEIIEEEEDDTESGLQEGSQ